MQVETSLPRFTIDKCSLISQWAWTTQNDCCPICRNSVNEESIVTENDPDCTSHVVVGLCGHAFHYECINKWVTTSSNVCPLCNAPWQYQSKLDSSDFEPTNKENITNIIPPLSQSFALPAGLSVSSNITNIEEQIIADSEDEITDDDMPALIDDQGNVV
ncbi:RING-H2 zinc finger domain [seawater metagenome]|uniref:RING-H2 zinc finger domain n=1 Tax=seawater metagenome TaxID=1561972 RepID=A0A5E8CGM3_9ZZZZ